MAEVAHLTWPEFLQGAYAGVLRHVQNLRHGHTERAYGADPRDGGVWDRHIEGACAEMAFAKYINRFWSGAVGDHGALDVDRYQLRVSRYDAAHLIIHPHEKGIFVLLTGHAPTYRLCGWLDARDAKRDRYWGELQTGRPAYNVPQRDLYPMSSFGRVRAS